MKIIIKDEKGNPAFRFDVNSGAAEIEPAILIEDVATEFMKGIESRYHIGATEEKHGGRHLTIAPGSGKDSGDFIVEAGLFLGAGKASAATIPNSGVTDILGNDDEPVGPVITVENERRTILTIDVGARRVRVSSGLDMNKVATDFVGALERALYCKSQFGRATVRDHIMLCANNFTLFLKTGDESTGGGDMTIHNPAHPEGQLGPFEEVDA